MPHCYPTMRAAWRATSRQRKKGKIGYIYQVQLHPKGRPTDVFSAWSVKVKDLKTHELPISRIAIRAYPEFEWTRGYSRVHEEYQPDAELVGHRKFYLEYFSGEMSEAQVRKEMKKYEPLLQLNPHRPEAEREYVLNVSADDKEAGNQMRWCRYLLGEWGMYSTIDRILADPYGGIWTVLKGDEAEVAELQNPAAENAGESTGEMAGETA